MRFFRQRRLVRTLLVAGALLLALDLGLVLALSHGPRKAAPPPVTTTVTAPPVTTTAPAPPPTTTTQPAPVPVPPPPLVAMSWNSAGAIVWHAHDVDPEWLGRTLRADGFGWAAVVLGNNGTAEPTDPGWIERFREASGLPVGGWSSLGVDPAADARLAISQIRQDSFAFYIADAEATYMRGPSKNEAQYARSQQFLTAFRAAEPTLPLGLSSYCVADDLDIAAWARAGAAFLPQAYVNDFGAEVTPAVCARSAAPFALSQVHPTVASYAGRFGRVAPARFSQLLSAAGTTGFSVYPAEVAMTDADWAAYGHAIAALHIAAVPQPAS